VVAGVREEVVGWALLSPVSGRCIYAGVAEVSVYVAAVARGRGVGRQLLSQLVWRAEQAGIFPENTASIALHEACGFRIVGRRQRLGKLAGVWRDVELLERRSEHW
jgi:phosphinothricin acetyltransferase